MSSGAVDPNFVPAGFRFPFSNPGQPEVYDVPGEIDGLHTVAGKVVVTGYFERVGTLDGPVRRGVARLNGNGTLDESFDPVGGFDSKFSWLVDGVAIRPVTGEIVAVGRFTEFNDTQAPGVVQLSTNGALDMAFLAQMRPGFDSVPVAVAVQDDGRLLVGGHFGRIGDVSRPGLVRLNVDGTVDETFDTGAGFITSLPDASTITAGVTQIAIQGDGKIVVSGAFNSFEGATRNGLLRLNADGSLDPSFDPEGGFYYESAPGTINKLQLWRDPANPSAPERIVVIGSFSHHLDLGTDSEGNPTPTLSAHEGIARLNSDGSLDTTFTGSGFGHSSFGHPSMQALLVQPDGRIVAGGNFTSYNGTASNTLARLNGDGSLDTTFDPSAVFLSPGFPAAFAVQDDGKLMVAGYFALNDPSVYFTTMVRLNEDGSKDGTFDAGTGFHDEFAGALYDILLQADGKILAAGTFLNYRDVARRSIARVNANGTLDTTFTPGSGFGGDGDVLDIALQSDGKVIAAGTFNRYNGTVRDYLARIHGGAGDGGPDEEEQHLKLTGTASSTSDLTGETTRPGDVLTYTLTYANVSEAAVTDGVITATIPEGTNFKPAAPKDGSRLVTRKVNGRFVKQVEWKVGALAVNNEETVTFRVLVPKTARIESEIDFIKYQIVGRRNSASLLPSRGVPIRSLVLSLLDINSTTMTSEVGPGGLITYEFTVRNDGGASMRDVQLRYAVQTGTAVVSAFFLDDLGAETGSPVPAPGGGFNPNVDARGEEVTWYFGTVPAHTTKKARLTVRVWYDRDVTSAMQGGDLVGTFRYPKKLNTGSNIVPETVEASNEAAVERPYLGLSRTVDGVALISDPTFDEVPATTAGDTFTFTLWYYNIGERSAERAYIQDRIPEGCNLVPNSVRVNDALPARKVVATDRGRTILVPLGTVGAGAFGKVSYRLKALPRSAGGILLNAFLESKGGHIGSAGLGGTVDVNPDPFRVKLVAPVSFSPSTEERPSRAAIGDVVQHFIRFTNNGGVAAKNARVTNAIPPGAKFRGATYLNPANDSEDLGSLRNGVPIAKPADGAITGDIVFRLGKMDAGETVAVRVDLEKTDAVLDLNPPELVNVARMDHGPERTTQRYATTNQVDPNPFRLPPSVLAVGRTPVLDTSVPRFFLGVMAPAGVKAGETFTYLGFYGNTGDTAGIATIHLHVPPTFAAITLINLETDRADPTASANTDADGNITITAEIPANTRLSFQIVCLATGPAGNVIVSSGHRISGDRFSLVAARKPLATYIHPADAGFDPTAARSAIATAVLGAAGVNFAYGRDDAAFKEELRQLSASTISTILVGADYIALKNGAFAVPLGGGQVLVGAAGIVSNDGATIVLNDGATIVSNDGATIVSNDGATIVFGGAGNIRFEGLPGFTGSPTAATLLNDPNAIVSGGAGNVMNLGGHNLFSGINGAALVNNAAGGIANADYFRGAISGIVSGGAGNLLEQAEVIQGGRPAKAIVDRGYRGARHVGGTEILVPDKPPAEQSPSQRQAMRKRFRRRCAIEPTIGHLKSDFRLARNYLRGFAGDSLNLMLAAAAWNLRKWMRLLRLFLRLLLIAPCQPLLASPRSA